MTEEHSYTSCGDAELNNIGYCKRCTDLAHDELIALRLRVGNLEYAAREMLSTFTEAGHPGEPAVRSCWVNRETRLNWHRLVNPE